MKLASLKGGRDGRLVVVNSDLTRFMPAEGIADTLQEALDSWQTTAPPLMRLAAQVCSKGMPFDPRECAAPLPRAFHWVDGSAYVNHVELVRKARGAEMPPSFWTDPLVYQGGSDDFTGPMDDVVFADEAWGIDLEGEVAVITGDVPMGSTAEDVRARGDIKLIVLANDWSLRNLIPSELAKGFGFYQSKPATSFSPIAATPDELGTAWDGGRLHLPLWCRVNGQTLGRPNAGVDMTFDFPTLIEHCAKTRNLGAGTIVGSGTVSNRDRSTGHACLAECRILEQLEEGEPRTPFLHFGDRVRIEMLDGQGQQVFGSIEQRVREFRPLTCG